MNVSAPDVQQMSSAREFAASGAALDSRSNDPFFHTMTAAQEQLRGLDWPSGLAGWLVAHSPELYAQLYAALPDLIDASWGSTPLDEFESLLDQWVETHRQAMRLWQASGSPETS